MAKKTYSYQIIIYFNKVCSFNRILGSMTISSSNDSNCLKSDKLIIKYIRTKRQTIEKALNFTRIRKIEETWMIYYGLTGVLPIVNKVSFCYNNECYDVSQEYFPLIKSDANHVEPFLSSEIGLHLLNGVYRRTASIAISYLYASQHKQLDYIECFRLLWSAFNSLYISFRAGQSGKRLSEADLAYLFISVLDKDGYLNGTRKKFYNICPSFDNRCWRWSDFLRHYRGVGVIKRENCASLRNEKNARNIMCDAGPELARIFLKRSIYRDRWAYLSNEKNFILLASEQKLGQSDVFHFIFSYYLYWRRCDSMHGNTEYPIYVDSDDLKMFKCICEILEEIVEQGIKYLGTIGYNTALM